MQVEIFAETLSELGNAMVQGRWSDVEGLVNPTNGVTIERVRYAMRDVVRIARLNIESLQRNPFLSQQTREMAVTEVQLGVSKVMKFTSDLVHQKYQDDEFDVYLFGLFGSRHEWLALAAIASASPCASLDYSVIEDTIRNSSDDVKYAYSEFISRRVNCPARSTQTYPETGTRTTPQKTPSPVRWI